MRKAAFAAVVTAVLMMAASRPARACGQGGGGYGTLITIALVGVAVDTGLTLWDTGSVIASHHPSRAYGVGELLLAGPQLYLGLQVSGQPVNWYSIWMGALSAHAIWTIATAGGAESPPSEPPPGTDLRSRARVSLGPTYVPLGPRSQPGLGLTGRF